MSRGLGREDNDGLTKDHMDYYNQHHVTVAGQRSYEKVRFCLLVKLFRATTNHSLLKGSTGQAPNDSFRMYFHRQSLGWIRSHYDDSICPTKLVVAISANFRAAFYLFPRIITRSNVRVLTPDGGKTIILSATRF